MCSKKLKDKKIYLMDFLVTSYLNLKNNNELVAQFNTNNYIINSLNSFCLDFLNRSVE